MTRPHNTADSRFQSVSAPDFLPPPQLRDLQLRRLQAIVQRAYDHVALFRQRMEERKVAPKDLQSLDDLARLPFSTKTDLRLTYPFGLFASPMRDIVRLHASTGTTGKPIVVAYTKSDIDLWVNVMMRSFAACGLHEGDIIQNAYGYGLFTGGLGAHYGAEALGATVIPISGGNTERQITVMTDFGTTAICCTPSYFLHIIDQAREMGVDMQSLPLRAGVFGAEPWTESMRSRIEAESGIRAYDIYGLSEITGPGVGMECLSQAGPHIFEDWFYPEIIDPKSERICAEGEEGELVLTTLGKQAMPMIRYRTRDITALVTEPCLCGRTLRRIKRITRRTDDMIIIRGVNVYPAQIESALLRVEGTLPHYQIVLSRVRDLDEMEVEVEVTPAVFGDTLGALEQVQQKLTAGIEKAIGLRAKVRLVQPHTIQRSQGKAKRVIDNRKM
ncbi:MAG: phenylacetate--CoA ligase family protein [Limisphaerales bacterium]